MGKLPVKQDVMNDIGVGAGLILKAKLDGSAPYSVDSSTNVVTLDGSCILGATRGGITFNPKPQARSRAVDGIAANTVGIYANDRFEPTLSGTFITATLEVLLKAVGFGDVDAVTNAIVARHKVKSEDYADLWFYMPISDGGAEIIKLNNAICTAGADVKTNDNGETEIPLTFVANYTLEDQDTPPFSIVRIGAPITPTPEPEEQQGA